MISLVYASTSLSNKLARRYIKGMTAQPYKSSKSRTIDRLEPEKAGNPNPSKSTNINTENGGVIVVIGYKIVCN